MKKLLLISLLIGSMPLSMMAQDDDLYFVPAKKTSTAVTTDRYGMPKDTYYSGSNRSVDEYNRRMISSYEPIVGDSSKIDIIQLDSVKGVYPDSIGAEDYTLTKKMSRFDGYEASRREAYWAGYNDGRWDWGWHSPWYYGGWYDPWYYDRWHYSSWRYGWYDPWYYGWRDPWYYGWGYPYRYYTGWGPYYGGGYYVTNYQSPRRSFGTGSRRADFGRGSRHTVSSRSSFGASRGGRSGYYNNGTNSRNNSFGASRSSSSFGGTRSSGSFGGGGGASFGGGGGGSRSGGGGGGFGRHR